MKRRLLVAWGLAFSAVFAIVAAGGRDVPGWATKSPTLVAIQSDNVDRNLSELDGSWLWDVVAGWLWEAIADRLVYAAWSPTDGPIHMARVDDSVFDWPLGGASNEVTTQGANLGALMSLAS